jgi:PAS domain S-box-containing protein
MIDEPQEGLAALNPQHDVELPAGACAQLHRLVNGMSAASGEKFFDRLVLHLAGTLGVRWAVVAERIEGRDDRLRTLAWCADGELQGELTCGIAGTACEDVIVRRQHVATDQVAARFPRDTNLAEMGARSYIGAPLVTASGEVVGALCVLHDEPMGDPDLVRAMFGLFADRAVAELASRRARQQMERQTEHFRSLIEHSQDMILELDDRGRVVFLSPAAGRLLGPHAQSRIGRDVLELVHPDDRARAAHELEFGKLAVGEPCRVELHVHDGSGNWRLMECVGSSFRTSSGATHGVVTARDVTERRLIEERMMQAQRMESVGRLAAGVAHDFNNLLTAIMGFGEMAQMRIPEDNRARADVEEILRAGVRASALTRQLLAFSRRQALSPRPIDVNATLSDSSALLQRMVGESVQIVTRFDSAAGHVLADPSQLDQVLMNLAVNARDAMPGGGTLALETRRTRLDLARAALLQVQEGDYVTLTVRDDGEGMDERTREHIFEPFFTTKQPHQGSGLGLATVYGIVRQSGGAISVDSRIGEGTTFRVWLPAAGAQSCATPPAAASQPSWGHETVLLVEDDAAIRQVARRGLQRMGYSVIEASSAEEALGVVGGVRTLDLVITDVVLPGLDGQKLVRRLAASRPGLPALFITGYTAESLGEPASHGNHAEFLQKPFTPETLLAHARRLLDAAAASRTKQVAS